MTMIAGPELVPDFSVLMPIAQQLAALSGIDQWESFGALKSYFWLGYTMDDLTWAVLDPVDGQSVAWAAASTSALHGDASSPLAGIVLNCGSFRRDRAPVGGRFEQGALAFDASNPAVVFDATVCGGAGPLVYAKPMWQWMNESEAVVVVRREVPNDITGSGWDWPSVEWIRVGPGPLAGVEVPIWLQDSAYVTESQARTNRMTRTMVNAVEVMRRERARWHGDPSVRVSLAWLKSACSLFPPVASVSGATIGDTQGLQICYPTGAGSVCVTAPTAPPGGAPKPQSSDVVPALYEVPVPTSPGDVAPTESGGASAGKIVGVLALLAAAGLAVAYLASADDERAR